MPPSVSEKKDLLKKYELQVRAVFPDIFSTIVDALSDAQVNQLFNLVKSDVKNVLDLQKSNLEGKVSGENTTISELSTDSGEFL